MRKVRGSRAEDISGIGGENGRRGNGTGRKRTRRGSRAEKGCEIPDEAGKRRLEKGAKPTVFFVAGIFALCRQDLFALLYLSASHPLLSCGRFRLSCAAPSSSSRGSIATPTRRYYHQLLNYHRRHEDRLVVAATHFSAQCRIPRPTGGSLSAQDIYQHPRWRHNLAGSSRGGLRTATSHPYSGDVSLSPLVNTPPLSLSLVTTILSRFLSTPSSSSSSSSSFSSLNSLWALCRTPRTFVTAKAAALLFFNVDCSPARLRILGRIVLCRRQNTSAVS